MPDHNGAMTNGELGELVHEQRKRIAELEAENRIFRQTESVDDSVWDALLEQVRQHQATIERAKVHASETMRLLNWDQLGWDVPELVIEELSKALAALEGEKDGTN